MCTHEDTVLRMGLVPGTDPQRIIEKTISQYNSKEAFSLALALLRDLNNLEIEHELACAAMCCWAQEFWDRAMGGRLERSVAKTGVRTSRSGLSRRKRSLNNAPKWAGAEDGEL